MTCYGGRPLLLSKLKRDYRLKKKKTERPLIARMALHAEELDGAPGDRRGGVDEGGVAEGFSVAVKYLRRYTEGANTSRSQDTTQSRIAFCTCRRFSAWSKIVCALASNVSSSISLPR